MKKRILSLLLAFVLLVGLLPAAVLAEEPGDPTKQVHVLVENTTWTKAAGAQWDGTLVDKWVTLTGESTMMSCVVEALGSYTHTGADSGYISEINGLRASDGGDMSGWMGTLNDWLTSEGFGAYTVDKGTLTAGDEIRVMYSCNGGADLGGNWNDNDKTVKGLLFSTGTLAPAFDKDTHAYTLEVPAGTSAVKVTPTASNKNFQVRTFVGETEYKRTMAVPVDENTVITVKCGDPSWPTMNTDATGQAQTYTITVQVVEPGYLSSLEFTEKSSASNRGQVYALNPGFGGTTHEYTLLLPDYVNNTYCWAALSENAPADAKITAAWTNLNDGKSKTGTVAANKALSMSNFGKNGGTNTATFTVGTQDDAQTYTVSSVRVPTLASLDVKGGYMNESFSKTETAYSVETDETAVTINAVPYKESYTVTYNGGASNEFTLAEDRTVVSVTVSDGTSTSTYTVTINRHSTGTLGITAEPADAVINLVDGYNKRIFPDETGRYAVTNGYSYTCTVTAPGYVGQVQTFTAESGMADLTFALVKEGENTALNPDLDAEWPNFRNGENHLGLTAAKTPTTAEETELLWAVKYSAGWTDAPGAPILVDGCLITYVGKTIKKLDVNTGAIVAENTMVGSSSYAIVPPTYADGMIFVGLSNGKIQAFNAETLESLWVYTDALGGQPNCPITYSDGYLYVGFWNAETKDANFVCINASDENPDEEEEVKLASWTTARTGGFYWAGAYASERFVVVGTDDGLSGSASETASLLVLNKKDGSVADSWDGIRGDIRSNVAYDPESDRVFFTSKGGVLCNAKIDWTTGAISDKHVLPIVNASSQEYAASTCTPSIYNGRVYIGVSGTKTGFCIAVYDLGADGTMTQAYTYAMPAYPQTAAMVTTAYMEDEGCVYIYLTYNAAPGGIAVLRDKPGQTAPDAVAEESYSEIFTPMKPLNNFCICSVIADSYGTVYYKNDSLYMMALTSKILGIEVTQQPSSITYNEDGSIASVTGLKVAARLANGLQRDVSDYVTFETREGVRTVVYTYGFDHESYGLREQSAELVDPVETAMDLIDAIGTVSLGSKAAIDAAREAYNALSDAEKALVENYSALTAAEGAYQALIDKLNAVTPGKPSATEPEKPAEAVKFSDVKASDWYYEPVKFVCENGLMNGTGNGQFSPNANTTRGMIVTILARLEGVDTSKGSNWYEAGQQWAMENGISDGTSMTGEMTREQLATMLYRYAQLKGYDVSTSASLNAFTDASSVSDWAVEAMQWAVGTGLMEGSNNQLTPTAPATRAQIAAILMRFMENVAR